VDERIPLARKIPSTPNPVADGKLLPSDYAILTPGPLYEIYKSSMQRISWNTFEVQFLSTASVMNKSGNLQATYFKEPFNSTLEGKESMPAISENELTA
jgi:hypothetical protein